VCSSKQTHFLNKRGESKYRHETKNNLYLPQGNQTIYQKGAYYLGLKMFNNLPMEIKNASDNVKELKAA
jgi:hypothetical protein